jgi:hypothetical protein
MGVVPPVLKGAFVFREEDICLGSSERRLSPQPHLALPCVSLPGMAQIISMSGLARFKPLNKR